MISLTRLLALWLLIPAPFLAMSFAEEEHHEDGRLSGFRGAMLAAEQVTEVRLRALKSKGIQAIAIMLRSDAPHRDVELRACQRIRRAELDLYYWIEVAHCAELADANPEWMASLQGHRQWRRLFKDPPSPKSNEVVKTYPWVPILNKEAFAGQLQRVRNLLRDRPTPKGVFLNDLQGAPSACGCGNHLCRWTTDYGKIRTATPLGSDAAARFVAEIEKLVPTSHVIPVWTTECEEHDGAKDGLCAGVGCFKGICWKAYTEQLMPVARHSPTLGVLLPYRAFQRDLEHYGEPAGWIATAVRSFKTMPTRHQGNSIRPGRLITVLQGWDVTDEQVNQQIGVSQRSGAAGYLVSYAEIEQNWEPRLLRWK
jgi:hypothetical protein